MIDYFIYYTFQKDYKSGDGNVDIKVDLPISNIGLLREVEKTLQDKCGLDSLVICSFSRFDKDDS